MENAENQLEPSRDLIKSKKRVADHGEVFTPSWLVEAMIDMTGESDRIEARFLEPACGDGNFLDHILRRKLAVVEIKYGKSNFKRDFAILSVMSIYGIELLGDNIAECRKRLLYTFADYLKIEPFNQFYRAASQILSLNLVHGDALKMTTDTGSPIVFSEWSYLGKGRFSRCDFRFDMLTRASAEKNAILDPIKIYPTLTISEISGPSKKRQHEATI